MTTVFTIGHSNLSIDAFFALLEQHQIPLLVDVRTSPYSRYVLDLLPEQASLF